MGHNYILAYDLGTTGNKAVVVDDECRVVASAFVAYQTYFPFAKAVEQDPWDWWQSVREATRHLLAESNINTHHILGISFSGQMMGCVPVTRDATPIGRALIWADMRGGSQASRLVTHLGADALYRVLGNRVNASYSAAKMMWIHEHEPERFGNTYKFLQPKDFVVAQMTGCFVTDYSDACGTNLFDITNLKWVDSLVTAAGLSSEILPDLAASTDIVGTLSVEAAAELGLIHGIPVVIGGGDGACAAAGAGAVCEGYTYQYLGSSSWIGTASHEPFLDDRARIFNWTHVVPGLYAPTGTMQAAGASVQWLKSVFMNAPSYGQTDFDIMDEAASQSPVAAGGLIFLPYLLGERSPIWDANARGAFIGLKMHHSGEDVVRAVLEGVALNMKGILDAFTTRINVEEIALIGGGAKSRLWAQIFSDVYGYSLQIPRVLDEATAIGAAVTGGVGVGLFSDFGVIQNAIEHDFSVTPQRDNHRIYQELQLTYEAAYRALTTTFLELSELGSQ